MTQASPERRLAAILFSDIVDYTALMARSERAGLAARARHRALLGSLASRYGGRIVDENGDELVCVFQSALDAVNCALATSAELVDDPDLTLRIGIHSGDVVFEGGRVYGDGVNVASRVRPFAEAGGVCVSDPVYDSIKNQTDLEIDSLGPKTLKNVARPVGVYAVSGAAGVPARAARAPSRRPPWWAGVAGGLVLALALGAWWLTRSGSDAPRIRAIAVLPLANLSGDPEQEYFADGMTEALIGDLARIGSLRVISRTSAMRYKGSDLPLPQIARELGVDAVVEGTVVRSGDRVRITAQLIEASSDTHLWADRYERDLEDVLALQGEVATAIAREIRAELTRGERARLASAPAVDPKVHDLYLRGRYLWNQRSIESLRQSIRYFERVVEADPGHARGWAGLGDARLLLPIYAGLAPRLGVAGAREATLRALELDDSLAEAHAGLAFQLALIDWRFDEAEREFRRALELDPGYATGHQWYGEVLLSIGRTEEAIAIAETARGLDPFATTILHELGNAYLNAGRLEEAVATLREALDLDPDYHLPRAVLGLAYLLSGQTDAAIRELERTVEGGALGSYRLFLARAHARQGDTQRARDLLAGAESAEYVSPYHLAMTLWELGDTAEALAALERAFDTRDPVMIALRVPLPGTMSDHPRVAALYRDHGMRPPDAIR